MVPAMKNSPFKFGIVCDEKNGRYKVHLPDEGGMPTVFLPVIQEETVSNQSSRGLAIGSHVAVLLDDAGNTGIIIGPYYEDGNTSPGDKGMWIRRMSDGGVIVYDPGSGSFTVKATSTLHLEVSGNIITIDGSGIHITGDVTINGDLDVTGATDLKDTKINGITQVGN